MNTSDMELESPPDFEIGQKVRLIKTIRNDGTFAGREKNEVLARKGDVGYVIAIGTFLQSFYIYSVHFIELGHVIGCRARELEALDNAEGDSVKFDTVQK
ncbi:MAG: nitrogen fixation protein NifZ [Oscillatoriales cyanobacterium SM2_2_1]|nr:nitrogen fixation protein NifZ [Oscillatoriales cyanobacterium SM2_2_1]